MILHKYAASPYSSNSVNNSIARIEKSDGILLTLDGVYCCDHPILESLLDATHNIYVLKDDAQARGIKVADERLTQVDYRGFVQLVTQYDSTIAWD